METESSAWYDSPMDYREHLIPLSDGHRLFARLESAEGVVILPDASLSRATHRSRPVVVMLHGFTSNHSTWTPYHKPLHQAGFDTLVIDMRGHGFSDKPIVRSLYTTEGLARDLIEILDAFHIDKAILVGYSGGGYVSLMTAALMPHRIARVIALATNVKPPSSHYGLGWARGVIAGAASIIGHITRIIHYEDRQEWRYVDGLQEKMGIKPPEHLFMDYSDQRGYWEGVRMGFMGMPMAINLWTFAEGARRDFRQAVRSLRVPTTFIIGAHDPFISVRELNQLHEHNAHVTAIVVEDAGHYLATQYVERLIPLLTETVAEMEDAPEMRVHA